MAAALSLLAVACGDDDETGTSDTAVTSSSTATTGGVTGPAGEVPGCGPEAVTDAADLAPGRPVARCEPGAPAPQPLAERTTVTLSSSSRAEFLAPVLLAEAYGEFDKENIDFEFVNLTFADAMPQLQSGDIDIGVGGAEAGFFNAASAGLDIKWALGNFFAVNGSNEDIPQSGLWGRRDVFSDPQAPDLAELEGTRLASAVGLSSATAFAIDVVLQEAGLSVLDVEVVQMPPADMVQALENGAVESAWLLDPYWSGPSQDPDFVLLAAQPPSEPFGGLFFGRRLLEEERDVGVAFVRAVIRTINTHLDGDYQQDAEVMADMAEVTGAPVESLLGTPALAFDWELREGTTTRLQQFFIDAGIIDRDEPLPEADVVDRSFYLEAVGASPE
jgi:NitT/TauT family transport system substrate-binding protein